MLNIKIFKDAKFQLSQTNSLEVIGILKFAPNLTWKRNGGSKKGYMPPYAGKGL